jgi:hypothetical protein
VHNISDPPASPLSVATANSHSSKFSVGILAYGSLIDEPGSEIKPFVQEILQNVPTPFCVEYARSSQSRAGAPTLVPVDTGGSRVAAVILALRPTVTAELAQDWIWRRETRRYGDQDHYHPKPKPGKKNVVVDSLLDFFGVATVLYTRIGANISPLTPDELARRAVASAQDTTVKAGNDGISYLINAKKHGIITPLTDAYERAILQLTHTGDLPAALTAARGAEASLPPSDRATLVEAFCADCLWAYTIRAYFRDLFESGEKRCQLLAEIAKGFFQDLNLVLREHILLQQHKLIDGSSTGMNRRNLTSNTLLSLEWSDETRAQLLTENNVLLTFREKIAVARSKLIAHTDLRTRLNPDALGTFTQDEETTFWHALQRFVNVAHEEAIGGPFDINAPTVDGDVASLIHGLVDAIDYDDLAKDGKELLHRLGKQRYYGV